MSTRKAAIVGRFLIVANQTLGGEQLERAVRRRIERGDREFFIVVPMTSPQHETLTWEYNFPVGEAGALPSGARQVLEETRRYDLMLDEAHRRANRRLSQMLESIKQMGGDADGRVADADPAVAVKDALRGEAFDEIIISTLPASISRWLKMGLSSRVSAMTSAPVTTIEAEEAS